MALYEFYCETCQSQFEQITSSSDPGMGKCPKCHDKNTRKLISRFAVGGQGDLRESTVHGCDGPMGAEGSCQGGPCTLDNGGCSDPSWN